MLSEKMKQIVRIVLSAHSKASAGSASFKESWEFSVTEKTKQVIIYCSESELMKGIANGDGRTQSQAIALKDKDRDDMRLYLADMLTYEVNGNSAKVRILHNDKTLEGIIVRCSPICSRGFFWAFWQFRLRKYGKMLDNLMN